MAGVLACTALFLAGDVRGESHLIRLRNELIDTSREERGTAPISKPNSAVGTQTESEVSGLYLLQFHDRFQPAWRSELSARRVELLQYVPDDAFVARVDHVVLGQLRTLPFVRWVGPYKPEHKLHASLRTPAQPLAPDQPRSVTVLLSPKATPAETIQVRRLFVTLHQEAKHEFGGVLRGTVPERSLKPLAESHGVLWIEPGPRIKLFDEVASKIVGGEGVGHPTLTQELGFNGAGARVAVADSGLDTGSANGMHADLAGRVAAFFFYGALTDASDEHSHGTHVTGIIAGNGALGELDETGALFGLGVAPGATIVAQRMFDGEGGYEAPPTFEVLTHDAVRAGAEIGSNSWGDDTQGRYDVSAAEFDALVRDADAGTLGDQPYILEFSAGNAGPGVQTIGSPAVAKNVIATGASQNNRFDFFIFDEGEDAMADFSSRGPAEDGRIKPDVVAPGTWIASLRSTFADDNNAWAEISDNYLYQGGTSQAGPHVSGAAAVFVQYYRETYASGTPSPALVKAALINSAVDMEDGIGTGPAPNMDEGWGRVDLTELITPDRAHEYIDQSALLTTGQTYERQVVLSSADQPLKITLAYTDYPAFPAVLPALVNDLDLEVIAPDGRVYHGNQFDMGESVPDAPAFDNLNNVEGVLISVPLAGEYIVRIIARNVVQDSRRDTPIPDQDFALVVCGNLLPPEAGVVLLDRSSYRAPSAIKIKIIDADLMGAPSVNVVLQSATEPAGLSVLLKAQNALGAFTGTVATAIGPATIDARLQIAHGDWIRVDYYDLSDSLTRSANAIADLHPPVISGVAVTNQFGRTLVSWVTDEPANSVVRYNTNASLLFAATNFVVTVDHAVELTNLVVGRTYYFRIESTDVAGNLAITNGITGAFSFVAQPTATVLLVNSYIPDTDGGSPFVPLSVYTNALSQIGVTFDVWNATASGAALPSFNTLRPYPIVIWRVNDSIYRGSDGIPAAQQNALQQYLNAGGSFFMASMEILSRLGQVAFRTNALHVQQFAPNLDFFGCPCADCDEDTGVPGISGSHSDPVSRDMALLLDYSQYLEEDIFVCTIGPDLGDTFTPSTNAAPILFNSASGKPCGVRYPRTGQDSTGRVVFCSFPLDAIPSSGAAPNNRAAFLRNVIQFLTPGLGGLGTIALGQDTYRLPDLVTVEIGDADLAGHPGPQVQFHSDFDPTIVTVALQETPQPGLFRGFIPLIAAGNPPTPGRLRAANGNRIYARYFDASGAITLEATADVDDVAPVITEVVVLPGYDDAVITWSTDEPTDALVQFGESTFLGRTAYDAELQLDHEVRLTGLVPDRLYYFQVVSRDSAGNARTEDNGMNFLVFHTLAPLHPPFFDEFESSGANWDVFSGDDSTSQWTLGSPNNGLESSAKSGVACWGSSRLGETSDQIDTFLISPAIELTGGNIAHLSFWHRYDFTEQTTFDFFEGGELLIITNSLSSPVSLAEYSDANGAWEFEEIDLTPYVGKVVFLVWHHQLLAFESAPRAGWLLDDVSVTMGNVPPVTIQITNNLAQAYYLLSGSAGRSGQGYGGVFSNLPPGTYSVGFSPVPYYITPLAQTNTLASGGAAVFAGIYTFPDANSNGISDIWEQQYFGTVGNHPGSLDSDGDGFTDYSEFIAGTNPMLPNSHLWINNISAQTDGMLRFQWPAVPGRIYQMQGSVNFGSWVPISPWLQAASSTLSFSKPFPSPGQPRLFRLEVRP
ncbi:MAG: hypothetical protein QOF48_2426 [Verrucomicrobiota bacterium]